MKVSKRSFFASTIFILGLLLVAFAAQAGEWVPQKSPVGQDLKAVDFVSKNLGWAVGPENTLIHTRDSGEQWINFGNGLPKMTLSLQDVDFINEKLGWIVGSTRLCWEDACMPYGVILATENGGERWEVVFRGDSINENDTSFLRVGVLEGVYFLNEREGWAVGKDGVALHTLDGGDSWKVQHVGGSAIPEISIHLKDVRFINARMGWLAGHVVDMNSTEHQPVIYGTKDGGVSWRTEYEADTGGGLNALDFAILSPDSTDAEPVGWAAGEEGLILSYKQGKWDRQSYPWPISLPLPSFYDLDFASRKAGWLVGGIPSCRECADLLEQWRMVIFSTRNGGEQWEYTMLEERGRLFGVAFPVTPAGWVVGSQGRIFHYKEEFMGTLEGRVSWYFETDPVFPMPLEGALVEVIHEDGTVVARARSGNDGHYRADGIPEDIYSVHASKECYGAKVAEGVVIHAGEVTVQNFLLPKENCPPEILRSWAEPRVVWAGDMVELFAKVSDLDTIEDIEEVVVDLSEIGGGMLELHANIPYDSTIDVYPPPTSALYSGRAEVMPLTSYGLKRLPVMVVDSGGATDRSEIELFVITSWVEIGEVWARPNPVPAGGKVDLFAAVGIITPKGEIRALPHEMEDNQIKRVAANITELLGVDCDDLDCIIWKEMFDEDGDGIYICSVEEVTGPVGSVLVPIIAEDTLGHRDRAALWVKIQDVDDTDGDGVLDWDDNCTLIPNTNQRDTNDDGFGNICDPDLNNDMIVNIVDLITLFQCWSGNNLSTSSCEDADLDGNGLVDFVDLLILILYWGSPPGPAGPLV